MATHTSLVAMNIMLAVHEKKTTPLDLYRPLRHYISATFSERDAQNCDDDLLAVHEMRSELEKPVAESSLDSRRDLLLSYYKSLSLIEPRFTISFSFTWYDAFKSSKKCNAASIHFEKAAILFNLGAIYSQIALAADRTTANGLKTACNSFQTAAGAFAYLKENVAGKATAAGATVDLSPECAGTICHNLFVLPVYWTLCYLVLKFIGLSN
jgi:programmed cell death 6-interacting protein